MQVTPLHRSLTKGLFLLCIVALASACKTYSDDDKATFDSKIERFISRKDWRFTKSESGLYIQQLQEGTGDEPVIFGSELTLKYKGTLLNGTVFDQTSDTKPLKSPLKGLIMGFQEALLGQKKGAKLRLIVPPQLGYGNMELDKIPENSVLVFELEILAIH